MIISTPPNKFKISVFLFLLCIFISSYQLECMSDVERDTLMPTVFVAILVRNKEHTLPYFFGYLERLDYPKNRISLWLVYLFKF